MSDLKVWKCEVCKIIVFAKEKPVDFPVWGNGHKCVFFDDGRPVNLVLSQGRIL